MGRTAFFLRAYNDIDHIAPVIWKFIKKGEKPIVIFHTDVDYENDYRIKFLLSEGEVEIIRDLDAKYLRFQKVSKSLLYRINYKLYRLKRNPRTFLGRLHRKFSFDCSNEVEFLLKNEISQCVFEWGTPFERGEVINKYFIAAKGQGITTLCLPHGCNMFTHSDVNEGYRALMIKGGIADQSFRREYDYYVFQNPFRRDGWVKWGYNPVKTFAWGSARWCPEWQKLNQKICPKFVPQKNSDQRYKIVFMQYQSNYNIDKDLIWSLLSAIASNNKIQLIIKDSTRHGTNYSSKQFLENYGNVQNVEFVGNEANSPALIECSDCVIAFGSSIGIEALIQNKPLINPHYLISNRTHYEKFNAALNAGSQKDVILHLEKLINEREYNIPDENKQKLFKEFIYGGKEDHDVLESYYGKITEGYLSY
jgi:hypothetical protein